MKNVKDQISFLTAVVAFVLAIITSGFGFVGSARGKKNSTQTTLTSTSGRKPVYVNGISPTQTGSPYSEKLITVFEIAGREAQTMEGTETTPLRFRAANVTEKILSFGFTLVITGDSTVKTEEGVLYMLPHEVLSMETVNGFKGLTTDYRYSLSLSQLEIFEPVIQPGEPLATAD